MNEKDNYITLQIRADLAVDIWRKTGMTTIPKAIDKVLQKYYDGVDYDISGKMWFVAIAGDTITPREFVMLADEKDDEIFPTVVPWDKENIDDRKGIYLYQWGQSMDGSQFPPIAGKGLHIVCEEVDP